MDLNEVYWRGNTNPVVEQILYECETDYAKLLLCQCCVVYKNIGKSAIYMPWPCAAVFIVIHVRNPLYWVLLLTILFSKLFSFFISYISLQKQFHHDNFSFPNSALHAEAEQLINIQNTKNKALVNIQYMNMCNG